MGSIAEYTVLLCCNHFYQPCSSFVPSSSSGCLIARAKDGLRGRMKKLEDEDEGRGRGRFMGGNEKSSRTRTKDEDGLRGRMKKLEDEDEDEHDSWGPDDTAAMGA